MKSGYSMLGDEESDNKPSLSISVTNADALPELPAIEPTHRKKHRFAHFSTSAITSIKDEHKEERPRASHFRPQVHSVDSLGGLGMDAFDVEVVNSVELLVNKQEEKKRNRIHGKYFGRCLIVFPFNSFHNMLDAIWEHNVQKILTLSTFEGREFRQNVIWSKIKSVPVEHIIFQKEQSQSSSPHELARATEHYSQCLMTCVECITACNARIKKDTDLMFEFAGVQHRAHESVLDVIQENFTVKSEDRQAVRKYVKSERGRLEFYERCPQKKRGKLLVVHDESPNAAFLAIGYRMVVYKEPLQRVYALFRHHFHQIPQLNKLQVYVLQSLDYARFNHVTVSMDVVCFHNITKNLIDSGFLD